MSQTESTKATEIRCPVIDCNWSMNTEPPDIDDGALAEVFGWGVLAATHRAQALAGNEGKAEAHLKTHTVLEWVNTVTYWREACAAQVANLVEVSEAFQAVGRRQP